MSTAETQGTVIPEPGLEVPSDWWLLASSQVQFMPMEEVMAVAAYPDLGKEGLFAWSR